MQSLQVEKGMLTQTCFGANQSCRTVRGGIISRKYFEYTEHSREDSVEGSRQDTSVVVGLCAERNKKASDRYPNVMDVLCV